MTDLLANDPVSGYENIYKEAFADEAEAFFENAVRTWGIDPELNARQARELDQLIAEKKKLDSRKGSWITLLVLLLLVFAVWGIVIWANNENPALSVGLFCAYTTGAGIFIGAVVVPKIKHLSATLSSLEEKIKLKYACAADALAPLYNAFSWDTFTLLISKVIPQMKFDDFLSVERLADFKQNFGLTIQDEPESTLLGSHSGTFFGYPFIFTEDMNFRWGEKLWCGSRTVSYTVYETDADGKRVARTRTECLTATVTKPCPEFNISRYLFFGHDAAPELSYSREPSSLSGSSGLFAALGRKYRMHKLHKLEQNLTDDSEFTMMSNREFELLYKSENRNHEIGFRLLFTPLAQEYMVKLLKDQSVGYGDDFHLRKSCCVTCLASGHLSGTRIAQAPFSTDLYDLKKIKRLFCSKSGEFFRSIYFSFAPLFLVPIYNEERLRAADTPEKESISESELEGAAAWKSDHYKPEESITDNIFNIRNYRRRGNTVSATVEAIGFRGERRVDIVPCLAGNGKSYNVPVEWIEYIPVTCRTPIHACRENKISPGQKILFRRRGLAFW